MSGLPYGKAKREGYRMKLVESVRNVQKFIASVGLSLGAGGLGSLATTPNIPTWYAGLDKPPFLPPNEVFGPVWSILYILMGISLYIVWTSKRHVPAMAFINFAVQLVLNLVWSIVFFGFQFPWLSVIVIIALAFMIVRTIRSFRPVSKTAARLLYPYLAWVLFATYLTIGVTILN